MHLELPLASGYLLGSLLLGIPYLLIYLTRPDLRQQLIWGGVACLPLALTAPFFIPEYWNPPYYFGDFGFVRLGIEDFIFSFFIGGIASSIYEFTFKKRLTKIEKNKAVAKDWKPYVGGITFLVLMEVFFPQHSIISLALLGPLVAAYMIMCRSDLRNQSFTAGGLFMMFYFIFFTAFKTLFPSYVDVVYMKANLFDIYVKGVPIEELLFAFSVGCGWSILYEYVVGYREK